MPKIKIIQVSFPNDISKLFDILDLDEGGKFEDPLIFYDRPYIDLFDVNNEGLFAIRGKVTTSTLIDSYKWGIFPWFPFKLCDEAYWYCPKKRFVIFPENIHISHSLRNLLNKKKYTITINKEFVNVIENCRKVNQRDKDVNAWLSEELKNSFIELYKMGYAKSVELWENKELIGGFYGFWYKGVFQGESMFSLQPSASQVCLIEFCKNPYIEGEKVKLIDTQFETPTFKKLGGEFITYKEYRSIMEQDWPLS